MVPATSETTEALIARAAQLDFVAREAAIARAQAELRALRSENDARLAREELARLRREISAELNPDRLCGPDDPTAVSPRPPIYYDASLILHFGLQPPVGLVRVDQYLAEFLARDSARAICFLIFDAGLGGFRELTQPESARIERILFHRYDASADLPSIVEASSPIDLPPAPVVVDAPPPPEVVPPSRPPLREYAALSPEQFDAQITEFAAHWFPVTGTQTPARRLAIRIARALCLIGARQCHAIAHRGFAFARHLTRPDAIPPPLEQPEPEPQAIAPEKPEDPPPPELRVFDFRPGDVLVSMGNCWDYLDYAYLHRICRDVGIRFVCAVYDVIAMRLPYTTPGPLHIYHRHWVEIGHCAMHLLAISRFTVEQYGAWIAEPNGLSPAMSYAWPPNFLRQRADEIGEQPVRALLGRGFVAYCSTIETRKNHELLLRLWDRLRLEFSPEELPILVFIGRWGWGTEHIRQRVERDFHARPRLLVLDQASDAELIWIYRNARFTLFPSLAEGYGLAAAESLSFGTPVVISDCPALVEATEGLMPALDPLDFAAWLAEIRLLSRDETRLDELRAAALRYRGPDYHAFGEAVREIALNQQLSATPEVGSCRVA